MLIWDRLALVFAELGRHDRECESCDEGCRQWKREQLRAVERGIPEVQVESSRWLIEDEMDRRIRQNLKEIGFEV